MNQEYIRRKIVQLSKELAEETEYTEIKRLRRKITSLKKLFKSSDPKSLTDLLTGK